jgi:hypothetical protein
MKFHQFGSCLEGIAEGIRRKEDKETIKRKEVI